MSEKTNKILQLLVTLFPPLSILSVIITNVFLSTRRVLMQINSYGLNTPKWNIYEESWWRVKQYLLKLKAVGEYDRRFKIDGKVIDVIKIVEKIKSVVDRHDEIKNAWIYGSFARALMGLYKPGYRVFRRESDIDVFICCGPQCDYCRDEIFDVLERELPEVDGFPIEWNTAHMPVIRITPFKIKIK